MKLTVNKSEFLRKIKTVSKVVKDNKIRPVISLVRLVAGDKLELQGTDLEQTSISVIEANIEQSGSVCLKATDVIESLSLEDSENIEIEASEGMCRIGNMQFATGNAEEYPKIDETLGEYKEINKNELISQIKKTIFCAATDISNIAVSVVRIDKDIITATDSYRMVLNKYDTGIEASIPVGSIRNVLAVLEGTKENEIGLIVNNSKLQIKTTDYVYTTRLIDLAFPDVRGIIQNSSREKKAVLNILKIEKSLRKVSIASSKNQEAKDSAIFTFKKGKLEIKANSQAVKAKESVPCEYDGEDVKTSLNVKYLLDFVSNINSNLVIEFSNNVSPFTLTAEGNQDYKYVTMPLAMKEE